MWKRKTGVWMRRIGVMAVSALLLSGCGPREEEDDLVVVEQETPGNSYEFVEVQLGDVEKTRRVDCRYRQTREQEITFPLGGRVVDRVYVESGDSVTKGQLLLELSSLDLERRIEDLEYRIARNELLLGYVDDNEEIAISGLWVNYLSYGGSEEGLQEQIEALKKNDRYQREDYSDALAADRAELELVKKDYASSRIYADIDGVVYHMSGDLEGSTSQLGETILTVMDTSVSLFETEVEDAEEIFHEGETVPMNISFGNGAGDYLLMPYKMDEWGETQLFEVYDGPTESVKEVGVHGTIIITEEGRKNVLTLPPAAIKNAGDKRYVYVEGENGVREVKWIETGLYGDSMVEIVSGLTEGEKVILK